jgi:hypothetical protein
MRTYRQFQLTDKILDPEDGPGDEPPLQPARVVARRGRIVIEEPRPLLGERDEQVEQEIDRLLDPAELRDVKALN